MTKKMSMPLMRDPLGAETAVSHTKIVHVFKTLAAWKMYNICYWLRWVSTLFIVVYVHDIDFIK